MSNEAKKIGTLSVEEGNLDYYWTICAGRHHQRMCASGAKEWFGLDTSFDNPDETWNLYAHNIRVSNGVKPVGSGEFILAWDKEPDGLHEYLLYNKYNDGYSDCALETDWQIDQVLSTMLLRGHGGRSSHKTVTFNIYMERA